MSKQPKQKSYQLDDKQSAYSLKREKKLEQALRKNLKRRRAWNALKASK